MPPGEGAPNPKAAPAGAGAAAGTEAREGPRRSAPGEGEERAFPQGTEGGGKRKEREGGDGGRREGSRAQGCRLGPGAAPLQVAPLLPAPRLPKHRLSEPPARSASGARSPRLGSAHPPLSNAALQPLGAPFPRPPLLRSLHFQSASSFKPRGSASPLSAAPLPPPPPPAGRDRPPDFLLFPSRAPRAPSLGAPDTHPLPHSGGARCPAPSPVAGESERKAESSSRPSERGRGSRVEGARAAAGREGGRAAGGSGRCRRRCCCRRRGCYRCCCHVSASSRRCSAPQTPPQLQPAPPPHFLKYATCVLAPPTPRNVTVTGAT